MKLGTVGLILGFAGAGLTAVGAVVELIGGSVDKEVKFTNLLNDFDKQKESMFTSWQNEFDDFKQNLLTEDTIE